MQGQATALTRADLENFLTALKPVVAKLSDWQIKEMSRMVNRTRREVFPDSRRSKIISRDDMVPTDAEEQLILDSYKPGWEKYRIARMIILDTGCRVGMVTRLKLEDIDFDEARVNLRANKQKGDPEGKPLAPLPLSINTFFRLKDFVEKNRAQIRQHDGHVFFSDGLKARFLGQKFDHVLPVTIRQYHFRAKKRAGLLRKYGVAAPAFNPKTGRAFIRPLYKYRMHDARTRFARKAVWQENIPSDLVGEMLGIQPGMVLHYAGQAPQALRDMAARKIQGNGFI